MTDFKGYWRSLLAYQKDRLCKESNLNKTHLSRIAHGKVEPNLMTVKKLIQADNNINIEMFLGKE